MPEPTTVLLSSGDQLEALRTRFEAGSLTKAAYSREIWKTHRVLFDYARFLQDTNVTAIEIHPEGVLVQLREPAIKLWCTPNDERHVAIASLNFRKYESEEFAAVLRLARACNTFFDIGANVGAYSIALGSQFPHSRIVAFEPIPVTFAELTRNLALNHIHNVTPHNIGLSDQACETTFYFDPSVTGAASGAPLGDEFQSTQSLTCPVETLDQFVAREGIRPDFIKCDVEGGELPVFRGAIRLLQGAHPIVFTEMLRKWSARFGYHPNDLIAFFAGLDYQCFAISGERLRPLATMTDETRETNFFFLHTRHHLELARFVGLLD